MSLSNYKGKVAKSGDRTTKSGVSYETIEFPQNLGSERYPHYVIFYINSSDKSAIVKEADSTGGTYDIDLTKRVGQGLGGKVTTRGQPGAQTGLKESKHDTDSAKSWISSRVRRLTHAIVLHMPHQVRTSYNANYEEFTNGGVVGSAISALLSGQELTKIAGDMATGVMKEGSRAIIGTAAKVIGIEGAMSALEKAAGEVENSRAEILFKNVGIREFEFNYIFAPKNRNDVALIKDIMYLFKYHMHPEISTTTSNGQYLVVPSEFDVEHYTMNEENEYINKITTCVLTSMNVDYAPNGTWQAFDGTGIPPHITMALRFRELEPLNRNAIEEHGF